MAQRPTSVTVIGVLYIVFGVFMLLGSLCGLGGSLAMPTSGPEFEQAFKEMPPPFRIMFRFFAVLAGIQLVVAVLVIITGVALLKLRPWSRPTAEILAWLDLISTLGFGGFWVWSVMSMSQAMPADAQAQEGFFAAFTITGVVMTLVSTIPPAIIIYFLRTQIVRSAFIPARSFQHGRVDRANR